MLLERVRFRWSEVQRKREEQSLRRGLAALERSEKSLEEYAFVRRMLIDEHQTVLTLEHEVRVAELHERRNGRVVRQAVRFRARRHIGIIEERAE
jgi:hypothetical protein